MRTGGQSAQGLAPGHRLRRSYVLALSLVALLLIGSKLVFYAGTTSREDDARGINIAGRQRMLSQAIAKTAFAYATHRGGRDALDPAELDAELDTLLGEWEQAQRALILGSAALELAPVAEPAIRDELEALLEIQGRMRSACARLADARDPDAVLAEIRGIEREFLPRMNAAVFAMDRASRAQLDRAAQWELAMLALCMALLVAVSLFVFEPAVRLVREQFGRAEDARMLAERASKVREDFLSRMSHELRTPLHALLGFGEILSDPASSDEEREEAASALRRKGDMLLQLVDEILGVTGLESGDIPIEEEPVQVADMARGLVDRALRGIGDRPVDVRLELSKDVPEWITTDPLRLGHALRHLLDNAVKYSDEGVVRLQVAADPQGQSLDFTVRDQGPGIPAAQQEHLFEAFRQSEEGLSRRHGGVGLGLYFVSQFARALGGDIQVESVLGEGSALTLSLPCRPCAAPESSLPAESAAGLAGRILVVDDGDDNRRLMQRMLGKLGLECEEAVNGAEALASVAGATRQEPFDLILMDVQMPIMDGLEATRQLRKHGFRAPILAVTAQALRGDEQRCLDAGCDGYLSKPVRKATLGRALREHLAGVPARAETGGQPSLDPSPGAG